ncbi:Mechanosensitive ion channel-domain-containing protein [Geopyxis carbonaria]|nr:Mechanosensitive ion channel-domain-containing protein [Geopyxis carbonaria]
MHISPTSPKNEGFLPLKPAMSHNPPNRQDDHIVNIPLTQIPTNVSTGARKEGHGLDNPDIFRNDSPETQQSGMFQRHKGRRRAGDDGVPIEEEEGALTTMGRFYDKVLHFSILTRYLLYIIPLALCFLIVILIGHYATPKATIGGVKIKWFFVWLEIVWCSLWVSKLFAKALPTIFQALVGVVSGGVKKYSLVLKALELPLSLVGWAVASLCSFLPLMTKNPDVKSDKILPWEDRFNKVLISCLVSTLVLFAEKLLIQIVSVDYHRRQFAHRIKTNKNHVKFLSQLYEVSRNLFPEYTEFAEEDYLIHQGLAGGLNIPGLNQSGSATPMRQFLGNINMVQDKVASAFGNIAQEVTGNKNVFNPNSAYAVVIDALHKKTSSEALAKRIWMSFVPEGHSALAKQDLIDVMGMELQQQAEECFSSLDRDDNGDVSLDEMILHVMHMRNERFDVAKSMQDVDNAISALDNVLAFIVFVIVILVFVVAQQSSVGTTIAGAGTVLISLSFVFAVTAQEILGSCIFLFVKHPYDVGDRVDVDDKRFVVEHISLLYTILKRVDNHKTTQIPNNVLNTKMIENITRSKLMKEQIVVSVHFDTTFEDIQKLKHELSLFVQENSRDFMPELDVEVAGIAKLDQLDLRIEIKHRGNWANETLTLQRRNKFFCALVVILRKIPIYAPGAGDPAVGEQGKPMYTVAVSDELAREEMKKAAAAKTAKRWDHEDDDDDDDDEPNHGSKDMSSSGSTAVGLDLNLSGHRARSPFNDPRPDTAHDNTTLGRRSTDSRRGDIEEVRGLLNRESTKGRRKPVPGATHHDSSNAHTPYR